MNKILSLLSVAMLCAVSAAARPMVYHVGPFDKISVLGDIDVIYRSNPDSVGIATYVSDTDYSDAIEITNNKGKLSIRIAPEHGMGTLPTLTVYSDYLSQVRNEGNGTVTAELTASTPTFSAGLTGNGSLICDGISSPQVSASITTGNGTIVLRGQCQEAKYSLTGAGVIQADRLSAEVVKCNTLGTGSIGCNASKTLDVRGVGSTKVYYAGNPKIKKVGLANIIPMNESDATVASVADTDEDADVEETIVEE